MEKAVFQGRVGDITVFEMKLTSVGFFSKEGEKKKQKANKHKYNVSSRLQ